MAEREYVDADVDTLLPSRFLQAYELKGHDVPVTILGVTTDGRSGKRRKGEGPVVMLHVREFSRPIRLNRTKALTIQHLYGRRTGQWFGKRLTLYPTTEDAFGETWDVVGIRDKAPVTPATPPATTTTSRPAPATSTPLPASPTTTDPETGEILSATNGHGAAPAAEFSNPLDQALARPPVTPATPPATTTTSRPAPATPPAGPTLPDLRTRVERMATTFVGRSVTQATRGMLVQAIEEALGSVPGITEAPSAARHRLLTYLTGHASLSADGEDRVPDNYVLALNSQIKPRQSNGSIVADPAAVRGLCAAYEAAMQEIAEELGEAGWEAEALTLEAA